MGKFSFFEQMSEWDCDLMCLSETWRRPDKVSNSDLDLTNFTKYRHDIPSRTTDGILAYAKSYLCTHRRLDLESPDIECITLELSIAAPKHVIFFCYPPPNQSPDIFFNTLSF